MRKTKLLLMVFSLLAFGGLKAQITSYPYVEDFEAGPAGWTLGGITSTWALGTPANTVINSAASGSNSWVTNLTGDYAADEDGWVESPVFDFTALNAPSIQARVFWESEFSWDGMVLQSSIDNGVTFQNVGVFGDPNNWFNDNSLNSAPGASQEGWTGRGTTGSGGWVTATHALTGLNNQSSVILRFAFGSDGSVFDEGVAFDFVEVFEVTCPQPLALGATSIGADSAILNWTEANTATSWDIQWGGSGFTLGTGALESGTTTNPFNLTGLLPTTSYDYYVRAVCGMGDTSVWTGPFNFTTIASCPQPLALNVTGIGADSVILNWAEAGNATTWDIQWGGAGFTLGTGALISSTTTNPFNLTGLMPTTSYDFYVRAVCGPGDTSLWSGATSFTTIASCPQPLALSVTGIGADSVILNWIEAGNATTWDIQWGGAGFTLGTGALISSTTTNPFNLTGLMDNTSYDFYVRAVCGPGDTSLWSGATSFTTSCIAFPAPYMDNIETHSLSTNFSISNCWTATAPTNYDWNITTNGVTVSTGTGALSAFSGTNYFYTEASGAATGSVAELVSPQVDISSLTVPILEFRYHMFGAQIGTLFTDIWDGTVWVNVDTLENQQQQNQADGWLKREVDLSAFSGQLVQVRFRAVSNGSFLGDICLDNINVIEAPSCFEPDSLMVSNLTPNSADLSWNDNTGASEWNIEWGGIGFTQGTGAIISSTMTNPHTLNGLLANTNYEFYVRSICGAGDTSLFVGPFPFLTPCDLLVAPWIDDVEVNIPTTTLGFSNCWNANPSTGFNYDWNIDGFNSTPSGSTGPSGAFSGTNYFYIETTGSVGDSADLLSPIIDVTALMIPTLEFRYHMFGANMGDLFIDISDAGGPWVNVDAIIGQQQTAQTDPWLKRFVDLSAFGDTLQVRFRAINQGFTTGDMSLDDIGIQEQASCPEPSNLNVTSLLANSVNLGWTENGAATEWDIEWGGSGFTPGTGAMINNTSSNPFSLTGLIENTSYDFYVRADCGAGDSSVWVGPITFLTPCAAFMAPWIDSVELHVPTTTLGLSECWNANPSTGFNYDWNIDGVGSTPSGSTGPSGAFSGANYFYIETTGSIGDEAELNSPNIDISGLTNPILEFYYHMFGVNMGDLFIEVSNNAGPFVIVDSIIGQQQLTMASPWLKRFISLSAFSGTVQIRFRAVNQGFTTGDMSLDDISVIEAPSCPETSLLNVMNLNATDVDLIWTENGTATEWQVEWGPTGFTQGSGTIINATTNPFNLTGLTGNTQYTYYVSAICNPGDTSLLAGPFNFLTPCVTEIAPYIEDVENHVGTTTFTFSECWNATGTNYAWDISGTGTTPSTGTGPSSAFSGTNYFFTEASNGILGDETELISPNVDVSPLVNPILEFRYHMFGDDMGTLFTDVWDGSMWVNVDAIVGQQQTLQTDPWLKRFVNLSAFTGTIQIRFRGARGNGFTSDISIDNINIIEAPTCPEPSLLSVIDTSSNFIVFDWLENGSATSWEVEWGPTGFAPGTGTTFVTSSNPDTLMGLTPITGYDISVRAICGPGDTSLATAFLSFITSCAPLSAPWIDDIEAHLPTTNFAETNCWSTTTINTFSYDWNIDGAGSTPTFATGPSGAFSGVNYFYVESSSGVVGDVATLVSPEVDVTGIVPTLEFRYHMFGTDIGTLITDVWNGSAWIAVDTLSGQIQTLGTDTFLLRSIELPSFTGIIQVRFRAIRGNGGAGDIAIDDIEIKQSLISTCSAASALTVTNTTITTVDLSWTDNAGANVWLVEWGPTGFTPGTGTGAALPTNVGGTPALQVTNLLPNTAYDFYVSTLCTFTDTSAAVMGTFMTDSVDCSIFIANLGADTSICFNDLLVLDPNIAGTNLDYVWSIPNSTSSLMVDSNNLVLGSNTITVTVTDTVVGCSATDDIIITLLDSTDSQCVTGIDENGNGIELSIYPNPNNGVFTLNVNTLEANELEVTVVNIRGQVVFFKSNFERLTNVNQEVDLDGQSKGIYFVTVTTDRGTTTNKIVVQ